MILIIGSNHDDILYFEASLNNKISEKVLNKYEVISGTIFRQDVTIIYGLYTSYVSSALTSYLLSVHPDINLVISVGRCIAYSKAFTVGQLAVISKVAFADVDQVEETNVQLGQIPNEPLVLEDESDVFKYFTRILDTHTDVRYTTAVDVSSNTAYSNSEQLKSIENKNTLFGLQEKIVLDCNNGGIALVARQFKVPFISLKVVEKHLGEMSNAENYAKVLESYTNIGKAVNIFLYEISISHVLHAGEGINR